MIPADPLFGTHVVVTRYGCAFKSTSKQRRVHRCKRINKKWRKRYGFIRVCPGAAWQMGNVLIVCPCTEVAMRKQMGSER